MRRIFIHHHCMPDVEKQHSQRFLPMKVLNIYFPCMNYRVVTACWCIRDTKGCFEFAKEKLNNKTSEREVRSWEWSSCEWDECSPLEPHHDAPRSWTSVSKTMNCCLWVTQFVVLFVYSSLNRQRHCLSSIWKNEGGHSPA